MNPTRTTKSNFICEFCAKPSFRKLSGTNIKRGIANRWCSMICRSGAAYARVKATSVCAASYCRYCTEPFLTRYGKAHCSPACRLAEDAVMAQRKAVTAHALAGRVIRCLDCDNEFCPIYGASLAKLCVPCGFERDRQSRAVSRVARKARQRGATVEAVNPLKVFQRDRWHCKLCGVATPQRLRGTYHDRAPELDHILPISKGGEHSYLNTQCACRKCNGTKSDRPLGQMLMFG